jgi:hypothetical protein
MVTGHQSPLLRVLGNTRTVEFTFRIQPVWQRGIRRPLRQNFGHRAVESVFGAYDFLVSIVDLQNSRDPTTCVGARISVERNLIALHFSSPSATLPCRRKFSSHHLGSFTNTRPNPAIEVCFEGLTLLHPSFKLKRFSKIQTLILWQTAFM